MNELIGHVLHYGIIKTKNRFSPVNATYDLYAVVKLNDITVSSPLGKRWLKYGLPKPNSMFKANGKIKNHRTYNLRNFVWNEDTLFSKQFNSKTTLIELILSLDNSKALGMNNPEIGEFKQKYDDFLMENYGGKDKWNKN